MITSSIPGISLGELHLITMIFETSSNRAPKIPSVIPPGILPEVTGIISGISLGIFLEYSQGASAGMPQ